MDVLSPLDSFTERSFIGQTDSVCGERTVLRSQQLGQTLQLTASGEARLATDPHFGMLLGAVSDHIHDSEPLEAARWLPEAVPGARLLKRTDEAERCHAYVAGKPDDVVIRIGGHCLEAQVQFDVMSWLHDTLRDSPATDAGIDIRAPEQHALLQSSTGTNVNFMQLSYGDPLIAKKKELFDADRRTMRLMTQPIREHLHHLLGEHAVLINDLGENDHVTNMLVDRYTYTIIDQPHLGKQAHLKTILSALERLLGPETFRSRYHGVLTGSSIH